MTTHHAVIIVLCDYVCCLYCRFIMASVTHRGHGGQTEEGRLYEGALWGHVLTREQ